MIQPESTKNEGKLSEKTKWILLIILGMGGMHHQLSYKRKKFKTEHTTYFILHMYYYYYITLHTTTLTLLSILHTLTTQQALLMQAKPDIQKYILDIFRKIFCSEVTMYY